MSDDLNRKGSPADIVRVDSEKRTPIINTNHFGSILGGANKLPEAFAEREKQFIQELENHLIKRAEVRKIDGKPHYYLGKDYFGDDKWGTVFIYDGMLDGVTRDKLKPIVKRIGMNYDGYKAMFNLEDVSVLGIDGIATKLEVVRQRNIEFLKNYLIVVPDFYHGERHIQAVVPVAETSTKSSIGLFGAVNQQEQTVQAFQATYDEEADAKKDAVKCALANLSKDSTNALVEIITQSASEYDQYVALLANDFSWLSQSEAVPARVSAYTGVVNDCLYGLKNGDALEKAVYALRLEQALPALKEAVQDLVIEPVKKLIVFSYLSHYQGKFNALSAVQAAGFKVSYSTISYVRGLDDMVRTFPGASAVKAVEEKGIIKIPEKSDFLAGSPLFRP